MKESTQQDKAPKLSIVPQNKSQPAPDQSEIARAAYYAWERDGRPEGRDAEYWCKAEAQLRAAAQNGKSGTRKNGRARAA